MKPRKTTRIVSLIKYVNRRNEWSTCPSDVRNGWNTLLEQILHSSGNYAGFRYLQVSEVPPGEQPGIQIVDGVNTYPDESRRQYYINS